MIYDMIQYRRLIISEDDAEIRDQQLKPLLRWFEKHGRRIISTTWITVSR